MFGNNPLKKYLPWTGDAEGLQSTASGLQYVILESGATDGVSPEPQDEVLVHYDGRLADSGKKFDSSFDRGQPARFPAGRLIPGWVEALQLMKPGDEWVVFIPSDLGYGPRGTGDGRIPGGSDLVFRVALKEVYKKAPPEISDTAAWEKFTPWDSTRDEVQTTETGLQYIWLETGETDGARPSRSSRVSVYYEGCLAENGDLFDSAYRRGEPIEFGVTQVIPGWTEMLQLMPVGSRALVYIPSQLGYGASGTPGGPIPPNADLIFEVQLMDFS